MSEKEIVDERLSASGRASGMVTFCCKVSTCIKLSVGEAGKYLVLDSRVVARVRRFHLYNFSLQSEKNPLFFA